MTTAVPPRTSHPAVAAQTGLPAIVALLVIALLTQRSLIVLAVGAVVAVFFVARTLVSPILGICLLVGVVYTNAPDVAADSYGMSSVIEPVTALALGALLIRALRERDLGEHHSSAAAPALAIFAGYLSVLFAGVIWAGDRTQAMSGLVGTATDVVIALVVVAGIRSRRDFRAVLVTLLIAGFAVSAIGVHQYLTSAYSSDYGGFGHASVEQIVTGFDDWRISGPYADANFYAQASLITVALGFGRFLGDPSRLVKIFGLCAATTAALAVVFSFSRGATLGLIMVVVLTAYFHRPQPALFAAVAVLAVLAVTALPSSYRERVSTLVDAVPGLAESEEGPDVSVRGRTSEVLAGLQMFRDSPLLGVGPSNYPARYQEYSRPIGLDPRREDRDAHSYYVEVAAETGIVGLFFFGVVLTGIGGSLRRALHSRDRERQGLAADLAVALGGYAVTSLFLHAQYDRILWILLALAVATSMPWPDEAADASPE